MDRCCGTGRKPTAGCVCVGTRADGAGMAPRQRIFHKYIELELQLGNIDRCRMLYEKFLDWAPAHCAAWIKFAELERVCRSSCFVSLSFCFRCR